MGQASTKCSNPTINGPSLKKRRRKHKHKKHHRRGKYEVEVKTFRTFPEFLAENEGSVDFSDVLNLEIANFFNGACVVSDMSLPDQPIVFASESFCKLTGYELDEILGRNCRFLQGKATRDRDIEALREIVRTETEGLVDITNYRKDGEAFDNSLYLIPLHDKNGKLRFYAGCQSTYDFQYTEPPTSSSMSDVDSDLEYSENDSDSYTHSSDYTSDSGYTESDSNAVLLNRMSGDYVSANMHPLEFENDMFKGRILFMSRTDTAEYFDGRLRKFEVQLQGKFKKAFDGILYMGGEVEHPLQLSSGKRLLCNLMLKFVKTFRSDTHYSFGDPATGEYAHIAFPLAQTMDVVIVTPDGETPPELGVELNRDTPEMHKLKRSKSIASSFDLNSTYTFAFFNKYLSFESWEVVNLPGMRGIDLHTMWKDDGLRLVFYTVAPDETIHNKDTRQLLGEFEVVHNSLPHYPTSSPSGRYR
eukprot:GFYU01001444.1.p1 GENE.GFYU01001444.1~~GFYU01001444.1.p1  ORF type:complete len:473 (+),score=122.23 GFYU01001444.1:94-1512(+)